MLLKHIVSVQLGIAQSHYDRSFYPMPCDICNWFLQPKEHHSCQNWTKKSEDWRMEAVLFLKSFFRQKADKQIDLGRPASSSEEARVQCKMWWWLWWVFPNVFVVWVFPNVFVVTPRKLATISSQMWQYYHIIWCYLQNNEMWSAIVFSVFKN